jgi:hypothetical protein
MRTLSLNFSFCVLLLISLLYSATEVTAQRFQGGVAGGFNLSQLDGDELSGFNKIGVNAGGRVAAILSDRWQLSMEMLFSQQGSRRSNTDVGATLDKIRLNLVEVPVMINFLEWKFHVSAGLSYSRLINYKVKDIFGDDVTELQDFNENLLAVILSATYYFNENIGLNIGWSKAITDLQAREGAGALIGRNLHFRTIYLF